MSSAYDALRDPHCRVARSRHVQKRLLSVERETKRARVDAKSRDARSDLSSTAEGIPVVTRSMVTASGGVTFQRPSGSDPLREVEVLKCIVLRENYIDRIRGLSGAALAEKQHEFVDLADLLRTVTLDVIDNVIRWKRGAPAGSQFVWNGTNYLLRIASDLDFLAKSSTIESWLGTSAIRNPFMISRTLDDSPAANEPLIPGRVSKTSSPAHKNPKSRKRIRGAPENSRTATKTPYETPVINDPDMKMPPTTPQHEQRAGKPKTGKPEASSLILTAPREEVDMIRILEAERILLQEEEMHGVYTRNSIGQIVPTGLGKDKSNSHGRHTFKVAEPPEVLDVLSNGADRRQWPNGKYIMEKAKEGGNLGLLNQERARGKKNVPRRRSRGAQLDLELRRAQSENQALEKELFLLQANLEKARADLATLEAERGQEESQNMSVPGPREAARRERAALVKASFISQTELEVERRQADLINRKMMVERKEVVRKQFHERQRKDQLRIRQETIERKQRQGDVFAAAVDIPEGENLEDHTGELIDESDLYLEEPPIQPLIRIEDSAATEIERVVRGRLGRLRYNRTFSLYSNSSLRIQSAWRGYQGKRRANLVRRRRDASVLIESLWRGHVARKRVWEIKTAKRRKEAATQIQKTYRGLRGRRRAINKHRLRELGMAAISLTNSFFQSDVLELAAAKADEIEPEAFAMVKCCLILTARGTRAPDPLQERLINWKACKRGLRRSYFLEKVKTLAVAARMGCMYLHEDRIIAVRRYMHDPNMTVKRMAFIERGSRAAQFLLQWLQYIVACQEIIPEFIEPGAYDWPEWKAVLHADDPTGLELWEPSETDYDSDVIDPDNYVPQELLRCRISRPRPLLVAVSDDIPLGARQEICVQIKKLLPGTFVHVSHDKFDIGILQEILNGGHSIILDVCVGMAARERNAFNRRFTVARSTLEPRPMFILIKGDDRNRGPRELNQGARNAESRNWPPAIIAEEEMFTGIDTVARAVLSDAAFNTNERKTNEFEDRNGRVNDRDDRDKSFGTEQGRYSYSGDSSLDRNESPSPLTGGVPSNVLKMLLEDRCSAEFLLASPSSIRQLTALAKIRDPPPGIVMIIEALIIALTPHRNFSGPDNRVGAVTWEQALPLLDLRLGNLSERMANLDIHRIPSDNLNAIEEYFQHPSFPKEGGVQHPAIANNPILSTLLWWIRSVVRFARLLDQEGGPPDPLSKASSTVFSSVISVRDGIQKFPRDYEPRQDHWPTQANGDLAMQSDGYKLALVQLLSVVLRDVRVYNASVTVPMYDSPTTHLAPKAKKAAFEQSKRTRLVIAIHRDPISEDFFFLAYSPRDSANYFAVVPLKDINKLLGPNSVEMRDPRRPPRDDIALYRRLLELLALERPRQRNFGAPALPFRLCLRRKRQRLLRTTRKLESLMATITASELAPGELLLDAYDADSSKSYSVKVGSELVEKICSLTSSSRERRDLLSKRGNKMMLHIVDRLMLRRATSRRPSDLLVHHGVVPGRKIFEGSISLSGKKHVVSVHVASATKALRVVTYYPPTSYRSEFLLSARARMLLLGTLNEGDRAGWLGRLFGRLHLHKPNSISRFGRTMSGSSESSETDERIAVLDKSIHKLTSRVLRLESSPDNDPSKPRGPLLVLEFCISPTLIRIQGQDDERFYEDDLADDTLLANFRQDTASSELLDILAYDRVTGTRYRLGLSEAQVEQLLGQDAVFECTESCFMNLAATLRLEETSATSIPTESTLTKTGATELDRNNGSANTGDPARLVALHVETNTIVSSAETKLPDRESGKSESAAKSTGGQQPFAMSLLPDVISAEVVVENLDATRSIPVGERSSKPSGELVYRHGHKIGQNEGRYVVFEVWRQEALSISMDNMFSHAVVPQFSYRLDAYEPATENRSAIILDSVDLLRSAVGSKQDLLGKDKENELIRFLLQERLFVDPSSETLKLCIAKSRLFTIDKVTPVNKSQFADLEANNSKITESGSEKDGTVLILPSQQHDVSQERGFKLLSMGVSIPILHETTSNIVELNIVSFFESDMDDLYKEQGGGRAPGLRIYAYNPLRQTNLLLQLRGPDLIEALEGDRLMLDVHRRQDMLRVLIPLLRIRRNLDPQIPDVLLLPWAKLRREKLFSAPPPVRSVSTNAQNRVKKLFSTGIFTANNVSVIVSAQLVPKTAESDVGSKLQKEEKDQGVVTDQSGQSSLMALWVQVYEPGLGLKAHIRIPIVKETAPILEAALEGEKKSLITKQLLVDLLRSKLIIKHMYDQIEKQTAIVAILEGLDPTEQADAHLQRMVESGVGITIEDIQGSDHHPYQEPTSPDNATNNNKLFILPSVVSGRLLAKKVAKLSGMYTVLTGHALVDKDNESNLRGVHIRAYCPTISQQASTSVDMCFIQSLSGEQIEEKAKQLLEDVQVIFDGVETHMKVLVNTTKKGES